MDKTTPAFPIYDTNEFNGQRFISEIGLTKREYFAAMAMQGLIATGREQTAPWGLAHDAVCCADSLLAALARKDTP